MVGRRVPDNSKCLEHGYTNCFEYGITRVRHNRILRFALNANFAVEVVWEGAEMGFVFRSFDTRILVRLLNQ